MLLVLRDPIDRSQAAAHYRFCRAGRGGRFVCPNSGRVGDEIAHVASALDKTARKLEEGFRDLEDSRQTLETLLNSMQEAVIAIAPDGRVLWANQRMERLVPSGVRLGAPLVQSVRDPEILASVQSALTTRDVTMARAAKIFSGRIFDVTAAPMPGGGAVAVLA